MTFNLSTKNKLARLLAEEDLFVQHTTDQTASFDPEGRVLSLPTWKNMNSTIYDWLIAHEVSHALHTPLKGWKEAMDTEIPISYFNIVEDARIDKLIQRKFPGIKNDYKLSVPHAVTENYLGINEVENKLDTLPLIDKINIFFKVNKYSRDKYELNFSLPEAALLAEMEKMESWDDVVEMVNKIWKNHKQNPVSVEDMKEIITIVVKGKPMPGAGSGSLQNSDDPHKGINDEAGIESIGEEDQESNGNSGAEDGEDTKSEDGEDTKSEDGEDTKSEDGEDTKSEDGEDTKSEDFDESLTDFMLEEKKRDHIADENVDGKIINLTTPFFGDSLNKYIVSYTNIIDSVIIPKRNNNFMKSIKPIVMQMVADFEKKKTATKWLSRKHDLTGQLNMDKLHEYKINDDIFKSVLRVQKGKSHGLLMYIDFSSSMSRIMNDTIKQLVMLSMFCRMAGIKYEVYGFTNGVWGDSRNDPPGGATHELGKKSFIVSKNIRYLNLFSDTMGKKDFENMTKILLDWKSGGSQGKYLTLNSTPLNETILAAWKMVPEFRDSKKVEIVNCIFLTDGASDSIKLSNETGGYYSSRNSQIVLTSPRTRKIYDLTGSGRLDITEKLLMFLREETKVKVHNFYITDYISRNYVDKSKYDKLNSDFLENLFTIDYDAGFDVVYYLNSELLKLRTTNKVDEIKSYGGCRIKNKKTKIILSKFVDMIS